MVISTGIIMLVPTCTVPKLTLEVEMVIWPTDADEIKNNEKRVKIQRAGLWGSPKQLMRSLSFGRVR